MQQDAVMWRFALVEELFVLLGSEWAAAGGGEALNSS